MIGARGQLRRMALRASRRCEQGLPGLRLGVEIAPSLNAEQRDVTYPLIELAAAYLGAAGAPGLRRTTIKRRKDGRGDADVVIQRACNLVPQPCLARLPA